MLVKRFISDFNVTYPSKVLILGSVCTSVDHTFLTAGRKSDTCISEGRFSKTFWNRSSVHAISSAAVVGCHYPRYVERASEN